MSLRRRLCDRSQVGIGDWRKQFAPGVEIRPGGDCVDEEEKSFSPEALAACLEPQLAQKIAHAVEGESDQVQRQQRVRQSLFSMAEIMFGMIALLEKVESLVFTAPACASAPDDLNYVVLVGCNRSDVAEGARLGIRLGIGPGVADAHFDVVCLERIFLCAKRQFAMSPPVAVFLVRLVAPGGLFTLALRRPGDAVQVVEQDRMVTFLRYCRK